MVYLHMIIAGLVGTAVMSVVMTGIHRSGWADVDMIRALGALLTRSYENSLIPGLAVHYAAGALIAIPYTLILNSLGELTPITLAFAGGALGFFHGAAMGFVLLALIADNHPVERFRNLGLDVAAAHVVGHVAYGFGVGATCAFLGFVSETAL